MALYILEIIIIRIIKITFIVPIKIITREIKIIIINIIISIIRAIITIITFKINKF